MECVLDARANVGEGPVWSPIEQKLWWVDITAKMLRRFDPATGVDEAWPMPSMVGCLSLCRGGGLVVAIEEGFGLFDPAMGLKMLNVGDLTGLGWRYNDGATSPEGRFLATTMRTAPPHDQPQHHVVALAGDHALTRFAEGLRVGNGLAFSPDGRTLYLADTLAASGTIWTMDWDPECGIGHNRRPFFTCADMPGSPDGAAVDADGCYWFAAVGGWQLVRLTPTGRVDRVVPVPVEKPTKPVFGGARLDTLYLTSISAGLSPGTEDRQPHAGGLFAMNPGVCGLPPVSFAI